ncbi:MAG: hypothetical protein U9O41_03815 [Candidatus Aerophobetes bacterium]|nr:hypothetical protein [Candidatus Aerophobetes bacterium]
MSKSLSFKRLFELTEYEDISKVSYQQLVRSIIEDKANIVKFKPDNICSLDPRGLERVVYSEKRRKRPYKIKSSLSPEDASVTSCPICEGKTTGVVDRTPLSSGWTFINKNLFPILYPENSSNVYPLIKDDRLGVLKKKTYGLHLVQWSSTEHTKDLHNLPPSDVAIIITRLGVLEEKLFHASDSKMPETFLHKGKPHFGYVGIIKNYGASVGGSLGHGHQQIVHMNMIPAKIKMDMNFIKKMGKSFVQFILNKNPSELTLYEGENLRILVPYFMRRPLETIIAFKDSHISYLHDLNEEEVLELALSLGRLLKATVNLMIKMSIEPAYNLLFHTGPIGEMYIEVLPHTQIYGGYEYSGIYACQGSPLSTAEIFQKESF